MTAPTMPARPWKTDAGLRPVPWRRLAWVTWRQHRFELGGVAVLVGGLALYLWLAGLQLHHAYAAASACHPGSSLGCKNQVFNVDSAYGPTAQTIGTVLMAVPLLIGAFVGAPVLARELETGTFRYAWTLGVSRQRWTLAKLVPIAVTVTVATGLLSLLFSWYYQPLFTDGNSIPLEPSLFGLRGVAYAAWTLAAFAIGALAGLLIRRVVPAIAATLAASVGLTFATGLYLREHYLAPLLTSNLNVPASAWIISQWWTKGGTFAFAGFPPDSLLNRFCPAGPTGPVGPHGKPKVVAIAQCLTPHGYTQWTSFHPASQFWPFQWIEGGWLLALSVLLIAATVWLVRRRPT